MKIPIAASGGVSITLVGIFNVSGLNWIAPSGGVLNPETNKKIIMSKIKN